MSNREMIHIEGVSDLVPKYWRGQLAIYFCNYCQTVPKVEDGQVAVSVGHDACVSKASTELLAFGAQLVSDTKAALELKKIEVNRLKKDIGESNPN